MSKNEGKMKKNEEKVFFRSRKDCSHQESNSSPSGYYVFARYVELVPNHANIPDQSMRSDHEM